MQRRITPARNLVDLFHARVDQHPDRPAFHFLRTGDVDGQADVLTFAHIWQRASAVAARLEAMGLAGERVILILPPGPAFIEAILGCFLARAVAVPVALPDPARIARAIMRLGAIVGDAAAAAVLTAREISGMLPAVAHLAALPIIEVDAVADGEAASWSGRRPDAADVAMLQYTSGSTGAPRGVVLSHANLLSNLSEITSATSSGLGVSWLPPYHDMGLIGGVFWPLGSGCTVVLLSPLAFLQRPMRWLEGVSSFNAEVTPGPDFALSLVARRATDEEVGRLDLSPLRVLWCGGEPVRATTLRRFHARFAAAGLRSTVVRPCYGLAEATLMVSRTSEGGPVIVRRAEGEAAREFVGNGPAMAETEVLVVDPEARTRCPPGMVGELWVRGPGVARGYFANDQETAAVFGARLATGEGPFLRTGDLGLLDAEAGVVVCGRAKDVVIVRGRNLYPNDVEATVEAVDPAVRPGCIAAFAVIADEGEECLGVALEVRKDRLPVGGWDDLIARIRGAVADAHEVRLALVALLAPGELPKTTSGKVQRRATGETLGAGQLAVVASVRTTAEPDLTRTIAEILKVAPERLDPGRPLRSFGLDSLAAVEIKSLLETRHGVTVPVERFFEGLSLRDLMGAVRAPPAPSPASAGAPPAAEFEAGADPAPAAPAAPGGASPSFSLFFFAQDEAESAAGKYDLVMRAARLADLAGFEAIWTPERHFHPFGGIYPSPAVLGAALAATTKRLRIRAGSVVLPLHHPIRVAEAWSVVDNLSAGRVDLAFASGWNAQDFTLSPGAWTGRHQGLFASVDQVRRLWRGEALTLSDGDGDPRELRIYPRPVQPELPVWITAAANPRTFAEAGAIGARVLTNLLLQTVDDLASNIAVYRRSLAAHGHLPERGGVTLMLHTFISDDANRVRETVRGPFARYLQSSVDLWSRASARLDAAAKADPATLFDYAFERYYRTSALFGTPDQCAAFVARLHRLGVTEIACLVDFGIEMETVLAGLDAIAHTRDLVQARADTVARCYDGLARVTGHAPATEAYLTFAPFPAVVPGFSWVRTMHRPESAPEHAALSLSAQRELRAVLFRSVNFAEVRRVLDIGCGYGTDLESLATAHPHLSLDGNTLSASQATSAEARLRARGLGDRVRVFCRDSASAVLEEPYDLVIGFEVAVYVHDKGRLFAALAAQMRPGATLLLAEFVAAGGSAIHHEATSSHVATQDEWAALLAEQGLAIQSAVDATAEIANFLEDPEFERNLADLLRDAGGDTALALHLRSWNNMGALLRRGLVRYMLLTVRRAADAGPTSAEENRARIVGAEPYAPPPHDPPAGRGFQRGGRRVRGPGLPARQPDRPRAGALHCRLSPARGAGRGRCAGGEHGPRRPRPRAGRRWLPLLARPV